MKDKRQRMAIAWPYAAVYTDPAFAASILQAAASTLPLHYGPPPPVYPPHYPRYAHWGQGFGLPQATLPMPNPSLNLNQGISLNQHLPHTSLPQTQLTQGLNIGLEFPHFHNKYDTKLSPTESPAQSEISLSPPVVEGLLIPATEKSPSQTHVPGVQPKLFKPYTEV